MEQESGTPTRERVRAIKDRIQNEGEVASSMTELREILDGECAELEKTQVA